MLKYQKKSCSEQAEGKWNAPSLLIELYFVKPNAPVMYYRH